MKQQNRGEVVCRVALALLLFGCGSTHHLGYDTATVPAQPGPSLNAVLTVEPFADTRRQNEPAVVFTSKDFPVEAGGTKYCLTLEAGYGGKVTDDLRSLIERHVRQRGVIAAWNADAERYRLDGTLAALLGQIVFPRPAYGSALGAAEAVKSGGALERRTTTAWRSSCTSTDTCNPRWTSSSRPSNKVSEAGRAASPKAPRASLRAPRSAPQRASNLARSFRSRCAASQPRVAGSPAALAPRAAPY